MKWFFLNLDWLLYKILFWSKKLSTWSYTILSIIFGINGKREMGLKFSGLVLDPFLYNGFNLAILKSLGKSPEEMEISHIFVRGFARIFAPSSKNLPEILSIPVASEMPIKGKTSKTLSVVKFRLKLSFSSMFL